MKNLLLVVIMSAFAVGCNSTSKDQFNLANPPAGNPPGGGGIQQQDLKGRSYQDVMMTKYNSAVLVCQLWSMLSTELDLQRVPNAEQRIDLKGPLVLLPIKFSMNGYIRGLGENPNRVVHEVTASIFIYKINIRNFFGISIPETGARYNFMYSPEIGFSTYARAQSWPPTGPVNETFNKPEAQIHEKLPTEVLSFESDIIPNDSGLKTRDYVKCVIETDIKTEYEHQFSVEAPLPSAEGPANIR